MTSAQNQLGILTLYEVTDAVRSRRALTLLILYLVGSIASCWLFIQVLGRVERRLVESMSLPVSAEAGQVTRTLWQSDHFRRLLTDLVGDPELTHRLLDIPPLSIFYGWLAFTFVPFLIILMSTPRIAEEVGTASVRYVLFRTTRAAWCLGKFAGQAWLLLAALAVSGLAAWGVGLVFMDAFPPVASGAWIAVFSLKAWIFGLPFLGMALGISQWTRSPVIATGIGLAALVGLSVVYHACTHFAGPGWARLLDLPRLLTPSAHRLGLWHPDPPHLLPALVMLLALAGFYFLLGYARFARIDQ